MIDIQKEIMGALRDYTNDVTEELNEAKKEVSKDAAKTLKRTSPRDTGEYAKGWRAKKVGNAWVVYNAKKPSLTHLLEKGHAKRGGGRVSGDPHIAPVEEVAIREYESRVERAIRG